MDPVFDPVAVLTAFREMPETMRVPYNKPYMTGQEVTYLTDVLNSGFISGDGPFTKKCSAWLESNTGASTVLLTQSCTAALEMCAMLCDLGPGDEVIMPSFAFVSSANAFALRGAIPVFVDVRADTQNIDESLLEAAVSERTKAIVVIHYAGVACEMDSIMAFAEKHGLVVIEDAAQGLMSTYKKRPLGSIGHLGCLSFHETKNIVSGEGGALLINDARFSARAEIMREKGTNRSQFFRGQVDKYTWVDIGSSYLPSELIAAVLWAQLGEAQSITNRRLDIWNGYHEAFADVESEGLVRRPGLGGECLQNGHIYYLLLPSLEKRTSFIESLKAEGIQSVFHYVPLHSAPVGRRIGRVSGTMKNTDAAGEGLVRLPLWLGVEDFQQEVISRSLAAIT